MKPSHTKKIVIVLLILVIAAAAGYGYMFYDLKSRNEHASLLLNDIEGQSSEESEAGSAKDIVKDVGPDIAKLDTRIVGKDAELVSFIEYVESLGHKAGVTIKIDSVEQGPLTPQGYGTVNFKVTTVGSWDASYAFANFFDSIPYKVTLSQASLLSDSAGVEGAAVPAESWTGEYVFSVISAQ